MQNNTTQYKDLGCRDARPETRTIEKYYIRRKSGTIEMSQQKMNFFYKFFINEGYK